MFELYFIYKNNGKNITAIYGFDRNDIRDGDEDKSYINIAEIVWSIDMDYVGEQEELEWCFNNGIFEPKKLIVELFNV